MWKLYETKNIVHSGPKSSIKENKTSNKYLGNFYLKDFRYISPEVVGVNEKAKKDMKVFKGGVKQMCQLVVKTWLNELLEGLKHFLYQGSLHGVKYIFEPTFSRMERATWIIIVVVSIAICTGVIVELFSKSNSTPFVNVIDSLPTPIWAVPFPSVVLCPHLNVRLSYANVTELDERASLIVSWGRHSEIETNGAGSVIFFTPGFASCLGGVAFNRISALKEAKLHHFFASRVCPRMASENKVLKRRLTPNENQMLQDFIIGGSPKCTDVVKQCYWRGINQRTKWMTDECCETLFKPLFTNYGLCYIFNGLPLNGMSNLTIQWQRSFGQHVMPETLHWGLDSGYPKVFPPDPSILPFRVMASGETNGLGLELYLNTSEHQLACDGSSSGFNLLISSPTNHVYTSNILRLPMDRMTTIEVSPITYKTDSNLRYLSPERRQCFFQNERQLVYYEFYTDSNCKHDLLILEAKRQCDCVLYNWPRKRITEPICVTARDFQCIDEVKAKVEKQLIYAYFADSEEQRPHHMESTSCHPACNDILYSSQVFYSDLIKDPADAGPEWGNPKTGEATRINVHFYDDMFLGQHRHAQYDDYYFVGAIGGLLSLFLGFSIISVAELLYFIMLRPVYVVLRDFAFQRFR